MIKFDDLKPAGTPTYRLRGELAAEISLSIIGNELMIYNDENFGLPISILEDQIKSGGLFRSQIEDCLILTNTDHSKDYFKYCITLKKQGKMATVNMQYYGMSLLGWEKDKAEKRRDTFSGTIMNLVKGNNEVGYAAENEYYDMLEMLFREVFQ